MDGILWDVITLGSYISKTIHPIFMKPTGFNSWVIESLNINFQSILKNFKNVIILTIQWHSGLL